MNELFKLGVNQQQNESVFPPSIPIQFDGTRFLDFVSAITVPSNGELEILFSMESFTKYNQALDATAILTADVTFGFGSFSEASNTIGIPGASATFVNGVQTTSFVPSSNIQSLRCVFGVTGYGLQRIGNRIDSPANGVYPDMGNPFQGFVGSIERVIVRDSNKDETAHFVGDGIKLVDLLSANEAVPRISHLDLPGNRWLDAGDIIDFASGEAFEFFISLPAGETGIKRIFSSDDSGAWLAVDAATGALTHNGLLSLAVDDNLGASVPINDNSLHKVSGFFSFFNGRITTIFGNSSDPDNIIIQSAPKLIAQRMRIFETPGTKNLNLIANNKKIASLSPVNGGSTLDGFILCQPNWLLAQYEGVDFIQAFQLYGLPTGIVFSGSEHFDFSNESTFVSVIGDAFEFTVDSIQTPFTPEGFFTTITNNAATIDNGLNVILDNGLLGLFDTYVNGVLGNNINLPDRIFVREEFKANTSPYNLKFVGNTAALSAALQSVSVWQIKKLRKGTNGGFAIEQYWRAESSTQMRNFGILVNSIVKTKQT